MKLLLTVSEDRATQRCDPSAGNHCVLVKRLQRAAQPVHRRFGNGHGVHGGGVGDIGVIALSAEDGIVTARFQSELTVLLREAQNAEAAAEELYRIVKLFDHALNQDFRFKTDALGFRQKIRLVPVPIVAVFPGHIGGDDHPAFRRIAPVMGAHKVAVLVVPINLRCSGTDLKRLLEILAGHGVVDLVEGEGEILTDLYLLPFQVFILRIRKLRE